MIRIGIYLAVGAIFHLIFVGQHFDFTSAMTWLWLFGWPLMLLLSAGVFAAVVGAIVLAGYGAVRVVKG